MEKVLLETLNREVVLTKQLEILSRLILRMLEISKHNMAQERLVN